MHLSKQCWIKFGLWRCTVLLYYSHCALIIYRLPKPSLHLNILIFCVYLVLLFSCNGYKTRCCWCNEFVWWAHLTKQWTYIFAQSDYTKRFSLRANQFAYRKNPQEWTNSSLVKNGLFSAKRKKKEIPPIRAAAALKRPYLLSLFCYLFRSHIHVLIVFNLFASQKNRVSKS